MLKMNNIKRREDRKNAEIRRRFQMKTGLTDGIYLDGIERYIASSVGVKIMPVAGELYRRTRTTLTEDCIMEIFDHVTQDWEEVM